MEATCLVIVYVSHHRVDLITQSQSAVNGNATMIATGAVAGNLKWIFYTFFLSFFIRIYEYYFLFLIDYVPHKLSNQHNCVGFDIILEIIFLALFWLKWKGSPLRAHRWINPKQNNYLERKIYSLIYVGWNMTEK